MSIFDWFFSKEEKEYYVSPLELLEDRIEIMEKDHLDIINRFFELEKRVGPSSSSRLSQDSTFWWPPQGAREQTQTRSQKRDERRCVEI